MTRESKGVWKRRKEVVFSRIPLVISELFIGRLHSVRRIGILLDGSRALQGGRSGSKDLRAGNGASRQRRSIERFPLASPSQSGMFRAPHQRQQLKRTKTRVARVRILCKAFGVSPENTPAVTPEGSPVGLARSDPSPPSVSFLHSPPKPLARLSGSSEAPKHKKEAVARHGCVRVSDSFILASFHAATQQGKLPINSEKEKQK